VPNQDELGESLARHWPDVERFEDMASLFAPDKVWSRHLRAGR
jgi:hypothetical protein